ncbi:MAG: class I SAM-dependent methyltransferase [Chitinophagaceae bacterium]
MKFLYYIRYFVYIAWNWNLRLALFSIFHEIRGENKYHLNTVRLNDLQKLDVSGKNRQSAEVYQAANYFLLENIFEMLQQLNVPDGFVDIGCGKGRALVVAAYYGFNHITGVDFAKDLCKEAIMNCKQLTLKYPSVSCHVVHADAADFTIESQIHVLFFFNPFKEPVMKRVIRNILASVKEHPRKIWVVYINPQHKHLFLERGFRQIYYLRKMRFVEAVIFEK